MAPPSQQNATAPIDESAGQSHLSPAMREAFDACVRDYGSLRVPFDIEMRYTYVAGNNRLDSVSLISPLICIDIDMLQSQQTSQDGANLENILRTNLVEGRIFSPTMSDLMRLLMDLCIRTPPTGDDRVARPAGVTLSFPGDLAEEIEQGRNDVDGGDEDVE